MDGQDEEEEQQAKGHAVDVRGCRQLRMGGRLARERHEGPIEPVARLPGRPVSKRSPMWPIHRAAFEEDQDQELPDEVDELPEEEIDDQAETPTEEEVPEAEEEATEGSRRRRLRRRRRM